MNSRRVPSHRQRRDASHSSASSAVRSLGVFEVCTAGHLIQSLRGMRHESIIVTACQPAKKNNHVTIDISGNAARLLVPVSDYL